MVLKRAIVEELGEPELLVSDAIARSLAANDQVKYYFALLQTARSNADHPQIPALDLKAERLASRVPDVFLDDVVSGARADRAGWYRLPHGADILRRIRSSIADMLACLPEPERQAFEGRLAHFAPPDLDHGAISGDEIDRMTSGNRKAGDSLHLVVMDAHRAINRLQSETATETLAGAHVHGLSETSRSLVSAFMDGLNRTAPLKFDHPGLGTTATEHDGRLLIQNDIGTTDAHVLIVRVEGGAVTLTYTDIHGPRLKFLQGLMSGFDVQWEGPDTRASDSIETGTYLLTTGTFRAARQEDIERYLAHVGSRLVFLIDWNRMRKRLRGFIGKKHAIDILKWAAENDYGHRGLIEIGGEQALAEAVEFAAGERLRYGDRLDKLIGEESAHEFLCHAMRTASTGLRAHRSCRAVLDEIKADLARYFESAGLMIFDIAARHAACGYDVAVALREAFEAAGSGASANRSIAARAAVWEARADALLNEGRTDIKRFARPASLSDFLNHADDAVDELEEAASLVDLLDLVSIERGAVDDLRELSELALGASQELIKCIACATSITQSDVRDDLDDFLQALERLVTIEHQADERIRLLRRKLITGTADHRALYLLHQMSLALETATDAYAHAGQDLRRYLMEEVIK